MENDESKEKPEEIFVDEEVLKILKESLKIKIQEERALPNKKALAKALKDSISQFLTCFRLVGYDLDGNEVQMTVSHTKLEKSALDNMIVETFGEFMADKMHGE
jgi:hypothetical protein